MREAGILVINFGHQNNEFTVHLDYSCVYSIFYLKSCSVMIGAIISWFPCHIALLRARIIPGCTVT